MNELVQVLKNTRSSLFPKGRSQMRRISLLYYILCVLYILYALADFPQIYHLEFLVLWL